MTKCELTLDEVARKVGKDRSTITNCLRLLKLPRVIQESLAKGEITPGHARAFLALEEKSAQIELWKRAVNGGYSVRQVEKLAKSGNPSSPPRKKRVETNPDPFLRETEDKLRGVLGTQVRINETKKGEVGRIEIEYYSSTDLERILDLILELE
jgi:ParB family chromosome partitioning protein